MDRVINESSKRITQHFGGNHRGVDLGWRTDENQNKVHANCKGTVVDAVDGLNRNEGSTGWGNYVCIKHGNGMYSRYAHLRKGTVAVKVGQVVDENTVIGIIGDSGDAEARHLHFEVSTDHSSASRINPEPYLTKAISDNAPTPTPQPSSKSVNVTYRVKTKKHGWLPEVKNLTDFAGYENSPITDVAIKVDKGSIKYRVHVKGGNWLPWVTGYNINDIKNGYAGNGCEIDAIQVYYYTPNDIRPFKKAKYKVNNYSFQNDTDTTNGQDGYAGVYGVNVTKFQIVIE